MTEDHGHSSLALHDFGVRCALRQIGHDFLPGENGIVTRRFDRHFSEKSTAAMTCARFTVAIVAPGTGAPR